MYVDESGDDVMDPSKWRSPDARYLGLTGVVIASETYRTRTHPEFEALKQEFFPHNPDDPVVLVRNQIVRRRKEFWTLQTPSVALHWEGSIIQFLGQHISSIITVVLDKETFQETCLPEVQEPYSHCMNVLTERYDQWLNIVGGTGDVLAENRGGKADTELKEDFQKFLEGNNRLSAITSGQIKLKTKGANITGLQLADLLGYPSVRGILQESGRELGNPFSAATSRFVKAIQPLYALHGKVLIS